MNAFLVLAVCLLGVLPAGADDFSSLRDFNLREFKARSAAFRAPPPALPDPLPFDASVPPELRRQLSSDLDFVRGLRYPQATPLHRDVFGMVDGADYMGYLRRRIKSVATGDCGALAAVACVKPFADHSKMWIGPGYGSLGLPMIYRVMVLVHEARHTEISHSFWGHALCPDPFQDENGEDIKGIFSGLPLAGLPGCDQTPLGAYGVGLLFIKNIERYCADCTGKLRMDASLYADDTLKRISDPAAKKALRDDLYQ